MPKSVDGQDLDFCGSDRGGSNPPASTIHISKEFDKSQDNSIFFDTIVSKFDQDQGILHGLAHKQTKNQNCMCPACLTRRSTV